MSSVSISIGGATAADSSEGPLARGLPDVPEGDGDGSTSSQDGGGGGGGGGGDEESRQTFHGSVGEAPQPYTAEPALSRVPSELPGCRMRRLPKAGSRRCGLRPAATPPPCPSNAQRPLRPAGDVYSVHSVHLGQLSPQDLRLISRMRITSRDLEEPPPPPPRSPAVRALRWYRAWALPGMGMFIEAWLVFSIG